MSEARELVLASAALPVLWPFVLSHWPSYQHLCSWDSLGSVPFASFPQTGTESCCRGPCCSIVTPLAYMWQDLRAQLFLRHLFEGYLQSWNACGIVG